MVSSTLNDMILMVSQLDSEWALSIEGTYARFQLHNLSTVKFVFDLAKNNNGVINRDSLVQWCYATRNKVHDDKIDTTRSDDRG